MSDSELPNASRSTSASNSAICNLKSAIPRPCSAFTLIEMLTVVAVLIIVLGLMVSLARYVRDQSANQLTASLLHRLDAAVRLYADRNDGQLPPVTVLIPDGTTVPDELTLHRTARRNNEDFVRALREFFVRAHAPIMRAALANPSPGNPSIADGIADDAPVINIAEAIPAMTPVDTNHSHKATVATRPDSPISSLVKPAPVQRTPAAGSALTPVADGRFDDLPTSIYDEVTLRDAWGNPIVFMPHDHPAIGMASRAAPSFFFSAGPDHKYLTRDDNLFSYESSHD